jgi:hypothetical protein
MTTEVAILNATTALSDAQIAPVVPALQVQLNRDFTPIWHISANLTYVPKGQTPKAGSWVLSVLDNSDQAGALGYHDITSTGLPLGKAFAATDLQYGLSWSVTISHELMEMLVDPWINLTVFNQTGNTAGALYSYEVCDACEDDSFAYEIDNIQVSDFVTPAWFEGWRQPKSTTFDFKGHITQPFQLINGGYISYFDVSNGGGWQQQTDDKAPTTLRHRAAVGSRRERRTINKSMWVPSTAV